MTSYSVWLRSVPSPAYAFYEGYVDVVAEDEEDAFRRAVRKLQQTSFPDRGPSFWRQEKIERR